MTVTRQQLTFFYITSADDPPEGEARQKVLAVSAEEICRGFRKQQAALREDLANGITYTATQVMDLVADSFVDTVNRGRSILDAQLAEYENTERPQNAS